MPEPAPDGARATGHCAVLYPAIAEAARRAGADAVGLIDVGRRPAALNLYVDRVRVMYSNGQSLGDPASPVRVSCSVVGDRRIPEHAMPEVVARIGVHAGPDGVERLGAELAPAATAPALLLGGDPVDVLPDAIARVPADATPVVITTWALSRFPAARRLRFLRRLEDAASGRAVAWVSAEGVGVAPSIPTLGDRRASGHSIVGLAVLDRSAPRAEALGRCWSRGRFLAWLADA